MSVALVIGRYTKVSCLLTYYTCLSAGRIHADGDRGTTAPRASDRRTTAGRQIGRHDVVDVADVIVLDGDVTTSAAARRRQAGRCRTSRVAAAANYRMLV